MPRRLSVATLVPLVPLATACSTMVSVPSPAEYMTLKTPGTVWVTKTDSNVLVLQSPQLITDTLTGFVEGDFVEMPLASVRSMRARQAAPGRTVLLVGALTLGIAGVTALTLGRSTTLDIPCKETAPEQEAC